MTIEVLVATMEQTDHSLLDKMNIHSDAIVANQCKRNKLESFEYKGFQIRFLSFAEKGVGLNRNNALMRSRADICILADDDLLYVENYVEIVENAFNNNPKADVIIFNLIESEPKRPIIKKKIKVGYTNFMRFGAARIAFKRRSITKCGISFNLHFGGGAEYSAGEDTLFLYNCLKNKLNIIALPIFIAELKETRESTWFNGYTKKYFIDRGALFACMSKKWAWLLSLQFCLRHRKKFQGDMSAYEAFKLMLKGIKNF